MVLPLLLLFAAPDANVINVITDPADNAVTVLLPLLIMLLLLLLLSQLLLL